MTMQSLLNHMSHGERQRVEISGQIQDIRAYISDTEEIKILQTLVPFLKKQKQIYSFDLLIRSYEGKLVFKLNPLKSLVTKGVIYQDCLITITEITKICRNGTSYFMIDEIQTESVLPVDTYSKEWCKVENYRNSSSPLGGRQGTWFLDTMSLNEIKINKKGKLSTIDFQTIPHEPVSLKSLDKYWSTYTVKPNILCRVLAVSKVSKIINSHVSLSFSGQINI